VKLTFKQVLYSVVLILAVVFSLTRCTNQILMPVLSKEYISQDDLLFQKSQEERLKRNLESVLRKLLGKNTYHVSVMMALENEAVVKEAIERDPQTYLEKYKEELTQEFERLREQALMRRPTMSAIRDAVEKRNGVLPGLLEQDETFEELGPLPGFPAIPSRFTEEEKVVEDFPSVLKQPDYNPQQKDVRNLTKTIEEEKVFYNEVVTKTSSPTNRIQNVVVNVVIDSDHFKLLNILEEDLKGLLNGVVALNADRGDLLNVSFMPFVEKPFDFNRFYLKNKHVLGKLAVVVDKVKWVFFGILILGVLGFAGWLGYGWFQRYIQERTRLQEEQRLKRLAEDQAREKKEIDELEERRKSVISLAKSKPQDFANLILSWVEAAEREGATSGQ